ncbi:hypothetical protein HKX48_001638 [Thoreauomyces humboldtii]|nr:hypothetical protein HKX48_001638 [Thoreauomyces humboldtii]
MLACVGESFSTPDEICGAVVSVRKQGDRIGLWTKDALNEEGTRSVGAHWKQVLQLADEETIGYQPHSEALKKNSSDMYQV